MFTFFSRKRKVTGLDFSKLKTDMHSHIISGIDDGAQSTAQSIELLQVMVDSGISKIVTTPHIKSDFYPNNRETIFTGLGILHEALSKNNINIQVEAAAEYYLDETFVEKLDTNDILAISGKYVLFELSFFNMPFNLFPIIEKIKERGYIPVLAHPERYSYLSRSIDNYYKIREAGCLLQLNTIALTGYYGKPVQKIAEQLVSHKIVDFAGSDMHHIKHAEAFKESLTLPFVEKLLNFCPLQNSML